MTRATPISDTVTIHVPFRRVIRGERNEVHLPDGVRPDHKADNTLVRALAHAFCWKQMLDLGERAGLASSYLTRILRLTLLAPAVVEAILDGKQGPEVTLVRVLERFRGNGQSRQMPSGHFGSCKIACL